MLQNHATLAAMAILLGVVVITVLFVPYVAVSYRRHGRMSGGRALLVASAVVYFIAIWAYTLLPLPDPATLVCAGTNLEPLAGVQDVADAIRRADGRLLPAMSDPIVLQLILNVLLFVPLGALVRLLAGRGFLVAMAVGLSLSLFIELTQYTGVWGLYTCAYRVLDVDDLITNTAGAVIGSLLTLALPRRLQHVRHARDGHVTAVGRPRRLLGMLCDMIAFTLLATVVTIVIRGYLVYVRGWSSTTLDDALVTRAGISTALLFWLIVVLVTGRTIGDIAVRIRYRGGPFFEPLARALRLLGGIGGYAVVLLLPQPASQLAGLFVVLSVGTALVTADGKGLPWLLTGRRPTDDTAAATGQAMPTALEARPSADHAEGRT